MNLLRRFLLLWLLSGPLAVAQNFSVRNGLIYAPDGTVFRIRGTNVNGPHWPWNRPTLPDLDLITNVWKFNTIRLNFFPSLKSTFPNNNVDHAAIVRAFTDRKVVVQLENHDFTGKYPSGQELENLKTFWVELAKQYKNNPYVWFNIMNEPGTGAAVPELWKTTHEAVIEVIRSTGAANIIILDEHGFGQGNGFRELSNSGVMTYGPYFTQKYDNIVFSLHLYSNWIYGFNRLQNYFQEAQKRNLSVHVGEFGAAEHYSRAVAADLFRVLENQQSGYAVWHWDGSDTHDLTRGTSRGGGWEIDRTDGSRPNNLSFVGNLIWKANRNELKYPSADFVVGTPWIYNGSFEDDLSEWFNWGGAEVEKNSANARQGSNNVRIASCSTGGCGQPVYLRPGETYVLEAWGRNSLAPTPPTDLGVQYKDATGNTRYEVLSFGEITYTPKRKEFTLPADISDATVFIWKGDKNTTFYADDIRLFLKSEAVLGVVDEAPDILLFPNPGGRILTLQGKLSPQTRMELTDLVGRSMPLYYRQTGPEHWTVRLDSVAAGSYVLRITSEERRITKKFIVVE